MKLRSYQQSAVDAVLAEYQKGIRSTLAILPTGTGKTIVFSHIAKFFAAKGRVLVLAHREELITQACEKIEAVTGERPEIEKAEQWAWTSGDAPHMFRVDDQSETHFPYVVSSIQTQVSGPKEKRRMHRFDPEHFSLVIVDEGHHATAESYRECIAHYCQNPKVCVLLVTATADRADGVGLDCVAESIAYRYEMPDAIHDGWLVPVRQRSVIAEGIDFSKCRTNAKGDLNEDDLGDVMEFESALHPVAHAAIEIACGLPKDFLKDFKDDPNRQGKLSEAIRGRRPRKTLIFAVSVAHAERLAEIINRWLGSEARFVCGETDKQERKNLFAAYAEDQFAFLVNVGVATEGFDEPSISLVVMGRPTKSRALAVQMIGRGTRPAAAVAAELGGLPDASSRSALIAASGKPFVEVLDFVGNCGKHKLVTAVDVLAGTRREECVLDRAKELAAEGSIDVDEAIELAEAEIEEQREAERMLCEAEAETVDAADERKASAEASRRASIVATTNYEIQDVGVYDAMPVRESAAPKGGASDRQIDFLVKLGVRRETAVGYTKGQASAVIENLKSKRCTSGQAGMLRRFGYAQEEINGLNFDEASKMIDQSLGGKAGAE